MQKEVATAGQAIAGGCGTAGSAGGKSELHKGMMPGNARWG